MIGLIVITGVIIFFVFYVWLIIKVARFVKRKTGSSRLAGLAILLIFVLTVGDTVFNRLYHKEVLCKRDDVGVKIFSTVEVPPEYWDIANNRPAFDVAWDTTKPFLGRYSEREKNERGGWLPLTAYKRKEVSVIDLQTGETLSRFVDYEPRGGMWWLMPLKYIDSDSLVGWFFSRQKSSGGCYAGRNLKLQMSTIYGPFKKSDKGTTK